MNKISASIITKNEESNIERCLESIKWVDEIIVVDSGSTDTTLAICQTYNCKIIETEWLGFGLTKQIGVNAATNDWVLSIDADEEVTNKLKNKILELIQSTTFHAFDIKRVSYYLKKRIKYSGWQTDYPLRLFNKKYGNFNNASVHESVIMDSKNTSTIQELMYHYPYQSINGHISKINLYTQLGAEKLFDKGKKTTLIYAVLSGIIKFIKMYVVKKGFLDGKEGFILAVLSGFSSTLKYFKLWSLWRTK
jgi:glycosyltransferase involved in cell wall biosynthesis